MSLSGAVVEGASARREVNSGRLGQKARVRYHRTDDHAYLGGNRFGLGINGVAGLDGQRNDRVDAGL